MKKHLTAFFAVCLMLAALSVSAGALEYTFDSPSTGDFGTPTSDETIYEWENPNVDKSKNSALIPPGFGTPTSYLPNSGTFLTPNLAVGGPLNSPALTGTITMSGGASVLPGAVDATTSTYSTAPAYPTASYATSSAPATAFTDVTSDLYYSNGSLGTLKIPAIDLAAKIVQGTGTAELAKGVGHFTNTSIWDGNVALAAHNRGTNAIFGKIHTLNTGDRISLTTQMGTRTYSVTSVMKVDETDNSMLEATGDNCLTLFTCVRDEREYRWCVRAVEVAD